MTDEKCDSRRISVVSRSQTRRRAWTGQKKALRVGRAFQQLGA